MRLVLYLGLGGALGTLARYGLQGLLQSPQGTFPWGTLAVNVVGSFALGFLMRYLLGSGTASPELRGALTIGFCGGFTTMSTFSYETISLLGKGEHWRAFGYVAGSVGGSVVAAFAGLRVGGWML